MLDSKRHTFKTFDEHNVEFISHDRLDLITSVISESVDFSKAGIPNIKINNYDGFLFFVGRGTLTVFPDYNNLEYGESYCERGKFIDYSNKTIYIFSNIKKWFVYNLKKLICLPFDNYLPIRARKINNRLILIKPSLIINESEDGYKLVYVDEFFVLGEFVI